MSNVDFSKITEGIYHVIETEEKILTGLQNDTITLKRNKQIVPSNRFSDI